MDTSSSGRQEPIVPILSLPVLFWPKTSSDRQRTLIAPAIYSIAGLWLCVEGHFCRSSLVDRFIRRMRSALLSLEHASLQLPRPSRYSVLLGSALDFTRSNAELVAENALLRQLLVVLQRPVDKPRFTPTDHLWLALLASKVRSWKEARLSLKPDTLLRWHRQGFRLFWRSSPTTGAGAPG